MPTVASVLADFAALTTADQDIVKSTLTAPPPIIGTLSNYVENKRFAKTRACPYCGSISVVRNGKRADGTQRYMCKDCHKSFVATSNSITSRTRKDVTVWEKFVECMLLGLSLDKTAYMCHIHRNTAFHWRHKLLDVLQSMADKVVLNGIVEADETFFAVSYKGNHKRSHTFTMPRPAHNRGHATHIRGLSNEKVCVPCAVNRTGQSIAKISNLARVRIKGLEGVFGGRIEAGSALVTDKASAYKRFTANNGLDLKQVKSGVHTTHGIYNIQHINNYHSRLKSFMTHFKGVSSKYLNNYLVWNNYVNYSNGNLQHKRDKLFAYVVSQPFTEYNRTISGRSPLPLAV